MCVVIGSLSRVLSVTEFLVANLKGERIFYPYNIANLNVCQTPQTQMGVFQFWGEM